MRTLLEMSLAGGILIGAVTLLRAIAVNRLPKTAFLLLWAAALCRLALPLRIPSPVSIYAAADRAGAFQRHSGLLLSGSAEAESAAGGLSALSPWAVAWLAGAALLAGVILLAHLRGRRVYKESLPLKSACVQGWMDRHRLRRPVQVRCSDRIDAPLTYGFLWPVILLPKGMEQVDELATGYVLAHEMAHIRRFDALWKWLLAAVLCLHWFNPLVWVMYVLANRDLELACDAAVLRQYGTQARAGYALALVDLEERRARFMPLASGFSKGALRERILAIMKSKPVTAASAAAALVLVAIVVGVFATSAPAKENAAPVSRAGAASRGRLTSNATAVYTAIEDGYLAPTQAQREQLLQALTFENYEDMSIAAFNRSVFAVLSGEDGWIYDVLLSSIDPDDPNAAYLLNTVQASMVEYGARLEEAYSGVRVDPEFYGSAEHLVQRDVFGESVTVGVLEAEYSFTYRILDQDKLTVRERDAFLQRVMQAAQALADAGDESPASEEAFYRALESAGKAASNEKVEFTGCKLNGFYQY